MVKLLTHERLCELLDYNSEDGLFTRKVGRSGPHARAGDVAGCDNGKGYIRIYIDGLPYKAHRLAWFWVHKDWPQHIDHINGDRSDNRISNLRSVTMAQNRKNKGVYKNSTSGVKGVTFYKPTGKWNAQIQNDGKKKSIGYFDTMEAAKSAYQNASIQLFGEFARAS